MTGDIPTFKMELPNSVPDTAPDTGHGSPPAEVHIDEVLVRSLLAAQHPDLAELPLSLLDNGFDNVMFRLGETNIVRLPRRQASVNCLVNEQVWLPKLAPLLPLPISTPVRAGKAQDDYPWVWSILPWIEGQAADIEPLAPSEAAPLANFLNALHKPAPTDAPTNPYRGVPIAERASINEERMARVFEKTEAITPYIIQAWQRALAAPEETSPTWLHGDLHARNVLVKEGRIAAIIDWGDITAGDRASDLACIWSLLGDQKARADAMFIYHDANPDLWARAMGWAVMYGVMLLDSGLVDHPRHAEMGRQILERLSADVANN